MFSQYFGQYLFNQGILTSKQLYSIFEYREKIRVKLGMLAMTSGLMTATQVEEVLEAQKSIDSLFGEIAISKGYLTQAQVDKLLTAQGEAQGALNQAIIDRGYLSLSELEKHLNDFSKQDDNSFLSEAILKEYQKKIHVKLGMLAMTSGLMTAVQVEEVLELQKKLDSRFGEIAINKGYLTSHQVDLLLNAQKDNQVTLNQAIIDNGYLSLSELEKHLNDFYDQDGNSYLSDANIKAIDASDIDAIVKIFLNFSQAKENAQWYHDYVSLLLRNSIRFIGENPAIRLMSYGHMEPVKRPSSKQITYWLISQDILAPVNLAVKLTMDENTLLEISKRISAKIKKDVSETDTDADIIAKFFNMHNNLFISTYLKATNDKNYETELSPANPRIFKQRSPFSSMGYRIPIVYSFGVVDILLEEIEETEETEESKKI